MAKSWLLAQSGRSHRDRLNSSICTFSHQDVILDPESPPVVAGPPIGHLQTLTITILPQPWVANNCKHELEITPAYHESTIHPFWSNTLRWWWHIPILALTLWKYCCNSQCKVNAFYEPKNPKMTILLVIEASHSWPLIFLTTLKLTKVSFRKVQLISAKQRGTLTNATFVGDGH